MSAPLDSFTLRHLGAWAERHAPSDEDPTDVADRLRAFLEGCDADDREFWFSAGWSALFHHVDELTARHAGEWREEWAE